MNYVHVHDILNLFSPIADAELSLLELLSHLLLLVRILCRDVLHVLYQSLNISKPQ